MDSFSQMGAVFGVLALLGVSLWWLRRRGLAGSLPIRGSAGRRMACLERLPLGPQHTLHLVRFGQSVLLISSSPAGCSLLQTCPHQEIEGTPR